MIVALAISTVCSIVDKGGFVNRTAYMDFKEATDSLFDRLDHSDLAASLGVSVASIRQARLGRDAKAHREPPARWRDAAITLAERQAQHYQRLVEELRADGTARDQ
jgi:hypothetical protein